MDDDSKPIPRRRFFIEGLRELFKPLAQNLDQVQRITHELGKLDAPNPVARPAPASWSDPGQVYLRPPGALPEADFRTRCSRSGTCVSVCPVQAIRIDPTGRIAGGAPHIDAETSPCVVCDGMPCMHNCPSGALLPVPLSEVDMGSAEWNPEFCLRTRGEECTICVEKCPLGTTAIELLGDDIHVIAEGCVGCGVCEHECPTSPKAITVIPRR